MCRIVLAGKDRRTTFAVFTPLEHRCTVIVANRCNVYNIFGICIELVFKGDGCGIACGTHFGTGCSDFRLRIDCGRFCDNVCRIVLAGKYHRTAFTVLTPLEHRFSISMAGSSYHLPVIKIRDFFCTRSIFKAFFAHRASIIRFHTVLGTSGLLTRYEGCIVGVYQYQCVLIFTLHHFSLCVGCLQYLGIDGIRFFRGIVFYAEL